MTFLRSLRTHWLLAGLLTAVALAWVFPEAGARGGLLRSEFTSKAGIVTIFLLQGALLKLGALRAGAGNWRLHALIQGFTFLVFPAIGWGVALATAGWIPEELRTGFVFLCLLPSTISTAVVYTTLAHGSPAGALFNATLSNLLGVVVTPAWVGLLLGGAGASLGFGAVVRELVLLLLVPLALGMLSRVVLARFVDARRAWLSNTCSVIILFIVYAAFCNSVQDGVWSRHGGSTTLLAFLGVAVLLAGSSALAVALARVAGLPEADRRTVFFCAPQKTLASGVPMAKVIFATRPELGLILLPLLLYHPLQLLVHGWMATRWKARPPAVTPSGSSRP